MSDPKVQAQMEGAVSEVTFDQLKKDMTAVKQDISSLSEQIAEALSTLASIAQQQAKGGLKNARKKVDAVMSDAGDRAGTVVESAQDAVGSIGQTLEDVVQERPVATLAVVLGLGFFIGLTWRR